METFRQAAQQNFDSAFFAGVPAREITQTIQNVRNALQRNFPDLKITDAQLLGAILRAGAERIAREGSASLEADLRAQKSDPSCAMF